MKDKKNILWWFGLFILLVSIIPLSLVNYTDMRERYLRSRQSHNPTLKASSEWNIGEIQAIISDRTLHWCNSVHGHVPGRGDISLCKGRISTCFEKLRSRKNDVHVQDLLLRVISENELIDVETRQELMQESIYILVIGKTHRAITIIEKEIENHTAKRPISETKTVTLHYLLWAIEKLGASSSLETIEKVKTNVNKHWSEIRNYHQLIKHILHVKGVLRSQKSCNVCEFELEDNY